jgi:hypothetical protein
LVSNFSKFGTSISNFGTQGAELRFHPLKCLHSARFASLATSIPEPEIDVRHPAHFFVRTTASTFPDTNPESRNWFVTAPTRFSRRRHTTLHTRGS